VVEVSVAITQSVLLICLESDVSCRTLNLLSNGTRVFLKLFNNLFKVPILTLSPPSAPTPVVGALLFFRLQNLTGMLLISIAGLQKERVQNQRWAEAA
jgi:hypothetical protein